MSSLALRRLESARTGDGTKKGEKDEYPVQEDHCFRRIAYDAAVDGQWDEAVPRPFEKHPNARQLRNALEALEQMARNATWAHRLNQQSLRYREENVHHTGAGPPRPQKLADEKGRRKGSFPAWEEPDWGPPGRNDVGSPLTGTNLRVQAGLHRP